MSHSLSTHAKPQRTWILSTNGKQDGGAALVDPGGPLEAHLMLSDQVVLGVCS